MTARLLHVSAGNLYGGVESMLVTLASAARASHGLEQHFAVAFEGPLSEELRAAGADVTALGGARISRPWSVWRSRRRMRALVARQRIDVAVCHGPWSLAIYGAGIAATAARTWLWVHEPLSRTRWLDRLALRNAPDLTVANSRFTLEHVRPLLPAGAPSRVIYPPVRTPSPPAETQRSRVRAEFATGPDHVVVLSACRMERLKGVHLLVDALGRLRTEPGWIAWIAGGAQREPERRYVKELQAAASELGVSERIRFLGRRHDVPRLLAAADIHCQPNVAPESFGLAFVEAMAHGLAVVTTPIGAVTEYMDAECAIFVEPDAESVARELLRAIRDAALRSRLGAAARARAARFVTPEALLPTLGRMAARSSA